MRIEPGPRCRRRCASSFVLALLTVPATAQVRFAELRGRMPPSDDHSTLGYRFADFDGDGDLDLAIDRGAANCGVQLLCNDGTGSFVDVTASWLEPLEQYGLDVYSRHDAPGTGGLALPFCAAARANVPMPGIGTLVVPPGPALALPLLAVPQPLGLASLSFPVPQIPALTGLTLHAQARRWQ